MLITAEGLGDINSIPKTTSVVASVDLRSLEGQLADEYVSSIYSYASHAFKQGKKYLVKKSYAAVPFFKLVICFLF